MYNLWVCVHIHSQASIYVVLFTLHLAPPNTIRKVTCPDHRSTWQFPRNPARATLLVCNVGSKTKLQCSFFYLRLFESKVWSYFVVLFPGTHSALVTCKSWANNLGTSLVILIPTIELYCTVEKDIVDGKVGKSATYVHSSFHFVQALMRHPFSGRSIGTSPASKNSQNDPLCDNVCITIDHNQCFFQGF